MLLRQGFQEGRCLLITKKTCSGKKENRLKYFVNNLNYCNFAVRLLVFIN